MSDAEKLSEAADSGLLQPRLVRHLLEGGALRRFSANGPNDARDNFHVLRWNGYRFDVRGSGSAFMTGDGCLIAAMYHPEEWEILPNANCAAAGSERTENE